jgi:hypothetical protein
MSSFISNLNRKSEKYGDVHFISFFGAILARLAYLNDNNFLKNYASIIGPVIQPKILQAINGVNPNNLRLLLDDQTLFGLNKWPNDTFRNFEYSYKGRNYLDVIKLNIPQNVNIINGETRGNLVYPLPGQQTQPNDVKYISIGWSNYGEVYVVADKRMPSMLFVLFRGTYSAKTASLYSKPTSIVPLTVCNDSAGKPEQFLYGIFKATSEMIHTIVEAMRYLATDFLGATQPNSVKVFTTGHSLGGAMTTDFAYLWMGVKKTAPYNSAPYNVLSDNIVCISLGAPRCMSSSVAQKFCRLVAEGKILYLRITTNGDPVTGVPLKFGYQHPCSEDSNMRQQISEACAPSTIMIPTPSVDYNGKLDCLNYKGRHYIQNGFSHAFYLYIKYLGAIDPVNNMVKGMITQREVLRAPDGSTVCRLIMGQIGMGQTGNYKTIFFNVNNSRAKPNNLDAVIDAEQVPAVGQVQVGGGIFDWFSSTPTPAPVQAKTQVVAPVVARPVQTQTAPVLQTQVVAPVATQPQVQAPAVAQPQVVARPGQKQIFGGPVAEDIRMTLQAFNTLIQQMVPIQGDLCPQSGKIFNPFNNQIMPNLSCPGLKIGGRRKLKTRKLKTRKLKTRKLKTRKLKKRKSKKNKSRRR